MARCYPRRKPRNLDATIAPRGAVAEWLGRGLQSLVHQFDSGRRLRLRRKRKPRSASSPMKKSGARETLTGWRGPFGGPRRTEEAGMFTYVGFFRLTPL